MEYKFLLFHIHFIKNKMNILVNVQLLFKDGKPKSSYQPTVYPLHSYGCNSECMQQEALLTPCLHVKSLIWCQIDAAGRTRGHFITA